MKKNLLVVGLLFLLSATAFVAYLQFKNINSPSSVLSQNTVNTEYGFSTSVVPTSYSNLDINDFKNNIDLLVQNNQKWIRFNLNGIAEVEHPNSTLNITWHDDVLQQYDQAITYAKQKGLKVFVSSTIPMGDPDPSPVTLNVSQLSTITQNYYTYLANRYGTNIDIWQVFNETDCHNFRDDSLIASYPTGYLSDLNTLIGMARTTLRGIISNAQVTTNTCGGDYSQSTRDRIVNYFDSLNSNLDLVSLDVFPSSLDSANYADTLTGLTPFLNALELRYSKPVGISEIGLCTSALTSYASLGFTEQGQIDFLQPVISYAKAADPQVLLVYDIQDEVSSPDCGFGIKNFDNTPKLAFSNIMQQLQPACNYTYTNWGSCMNGTQSRAVTSSYPNNCDAESNPAVLTQSCSPLCTGYTYTSWSTCHNGTRTRSIVSSLPSGCQGTAAQPVLSQACTPACSSYTYTNWSSCQNGTQTRSVVSSFPSGCLGTGTLPVLTQSCAFECTNLTLSNWNDCMNGTQTRQVVASYPSGCNFTNQTPELTQSCLAVNTCDFVNYSSWSDCSNGTQYRTVLSKTPSGCSADLLLQQSCSSACTSIQYTEWSACTNGTQTRTITSATPLNCDTSNADVSQSCGSVIAVNDTSSLNTAENSLITVAVAVIAVTSIGLGVIYILIRKNKI